MLQTAKPSGDRTEPRDAARPAPEDRLCGPESLTLMARNGCLWLYDPCSARAWTATSQLVHPTTMALLCWLAQPRRAADVVAEVQRLYGVSEDQAADLVRHLGETGLLGRADGERALLAAWRAGWAAHNWGEPWLFHVHNHFYPKLDYAARNGYSSDLEIMRAHAAGDAAPANYKDYDPEASVALPAVARKLPDAPLDLLFGPPLVQPAPDAPAFDIAALSVFLFYAYGEVGRKRFPVSGTHVRKTSPSGGSRHPTEAYVVALDVPGLPAGLYHYNVRRHALDTLAAGDHRAFVDGSVNLFADLPHFEVRAAVIYTSVVERSMHRYRESRSYRVLHFDLGHLLQTAAFLATAMGRPHFHGYTSDDAEVERVLHLDGLSETYMGYSLLG